MNKRNLILRILVGIFILLFVGLFFWDPAKYVSGKQESELAKMTFLRFASLPVFVCCAILLRLRLFAKPKAAHLLLLLPALAVAANNFPWVALVSGSATWKNSDILGWLLLQVVAVGVMEELAFRGILLPLLLDRSGRTKRGIWCSILLSSVIFGVVHLFNLIEGQGPTAVLMQVGYATLLGAMCAVLFLATGNLFYCIAVHILYNLGGSVSTYFIVGKVWNLPSVLCTVLVAVCVGIWCFYRTFCIKPSDLPVFTANKNQEKDGKSNA